jgi:hypothetical protein
MSIADVIVSVVSPVFRALPQASSPVDSNTTRSKRIPEARSMSPPNLI